MGEKWSQARITNLTSQSEQCSETQFKIQHINREMKKSVITHIFETTRSWPLYIITQANVKINETSATPDLMARSNKTKKLQQSNISSKTRKVKDRQTNLLNVD